MKNPIPTDTKIGQTRNTQLQLEAIVEESHDAIIGKTLEGIITSWNGGATKMFGYAPEEVIGKPIGNIVSSDHKGEILPLLEKVRKGEVIVDYDSVWIRKDGTPADVEFSVSPVHGKEGEIIGASVVGRDITSRKSMENRLIHLAAVVEESHDAIVSVTLDGIITSWNSGATKMFGYAPEEVIGKIVGNIVAPGHMEEHQHLSENIKKGETVVDYETVWVRKDGTRIDVEFSVSPIHSGVLKEISGVSFGGRDITEKKVLAAAVILRDITEKKKAVEELKFQNIILSTQQESSIDGILIVDEKGKIISSNKRFADLWGIPKDILESRSDEKALQFVTDKLTYPEEFIAKVKYLYANKGETNRDEISLKDGRTFDRYSAPMLDTGKKYYGRVWYFRDITDHKKTEEEIRQLSSVVEQSIDGMAIAGLDGTLIFVNEAWCRMHGYKSSGELLGKNLAIFHTKEQIENDVMPFTKKVIELGAYSGEVGHVTMDGKPFPTLMTTTLMKDKQGKPYAMAGISRDITKQKKEEEKIKVFSDAIEIALDCFLLTDLEGNVTYVNKSATMTFGYTPEEFLRLNISALDADPEAGKKVIQEIAVNGKWSGEVMNIRKDRQIFPSLLSVFVVKDKKGNPNGTMGIIRDITEQKNAEEKFRNKYSEMERLYNLTINRELKMVELKKEVEVLKEKLKNK